MLRKRQRELGYLDRRYESGRAELVVLYGRRRVGKTTLAYHWVQDKPHVFFFATQDDNATLLRRFYMRILRATAAGAHSRGDIEQAAAVEGKNLSLFLHTLQEMGLIVAETSLERVPDQ